MSETRCPRCGSPSPERHPAMQHEGEVQECSHQFHVANEPTRQTECQFQPGDTVFRQSDGQMLIVADGYSPTGRLLCVDANDYLAMPPVTDLTATDPSQPAEPVPQNCPFCSAESEIEGAYGRFYVKCKGEDCIFEGPFKPTSLEAIQSWNSIHIGPLMCAECCVKPAWAVDCFCDECYTMLHPGTL